MKANSADHRIKPLNAVAEGERERTEFAATPAATPNDSPIQFAAA